MTNDDICNLNLTDLIKYIAQFRFLESKSGRFEIIKEYQDQTGFTMLHLLPDVNSSNLHEICHGRDMSGYSFNFDINKDSEKRLIELMFIRTLFRQETTKLI